MKAVQIKGDKGAHQTITSESVPRPKPLGRNLLVKVSAAGITADEVTWPELYETENRVPGHDLSGTVEELGPEYHGPISVGDGVFAMISADASQGCQAEYAVARPEELAPKPTSASHAQAAALPIPILTAWEALFDHAKLAPGCKILVTGASGAVGTMLVQIARQEMDARVISLASARNHPFLKEMGACETLDYQNADWHRDLTDLDAVFDTVGGEILQISRHLVKKGGVVVTVADPPPAWAFGKSKPEPIEGNPELKHVYFVVTAKSEPLTKVARFLDSSSIRPLSVRSFPFDEAQEAWAFARQRGRGEKAVLEFSH